MYSKHAKCMLMENFPHPDFEVCFYNGRWDSVFTVSVMLINLASQLARCTLL